MPRFCTYETGLPSQMSCYRGYKNSIKECKIWPLSHCHGLTSNEKHWIRQKTRSRRSNWMCHAGAWGLFRAIYEGKGHKCEPKHVANLKQTMKTMLSATTLTQSLIHQVNGKVVYLIKTTDIMSTKLNTLSMDLKSIDHTFEE